MASSGKPREKKWERRSETRAAELTEAAFELFAQRGFAATRLEDVAAAAGVSKGTVYLYFESKERLFEAVVRTMVVPNVDRASELVDSFEGTTEELLRTLLGFIGSRLDGPIPAMGKLAVAESGNFPEVATLWTDLVFRRASGIFERVLQRGIERGELRAVNVSEVAHLVMAPVFMIGIWKQSLGKSSGIQMDAQSLLATHVSAVMRGLLTESARHQEGA